MEALLAHEVRRREARIDVAERLIDLALDVAGLVRVQQRRAGVARCRGVEIRRQRRDVELDQRERGTRGSGVVGGNRRDGLPAIADALAGQR